MSISIKNHGSATPSILSFLGVVGMVATLFTPKEIKVCVMLFAVCFFVITAHVFNKYLLFLEANPHQNKSN